VDGLEEFQIESDESAYTMYIDDNEEIDSNVLRYGYTSLTTPYSVFDYDIDSGERTLMKQQPVEGDFDPANYATQRFNVTARDGTEVPVSLVYRKPFEPDGSRPILVYGYGSYGSSRDPSFASTRLSLLDRGFVYAIAHIRGGQEMGRRWYDDGKMFNKMNTFTDFVDVTRGLVDRGYGAADKVFAYGGSAGGLLMGAVINQAPELYRGVIAAVPFVDVVTTMLDESIPLTTGEFDEWGNPKDKAEYQYMLSYSPYDQVTTQAYPSMLVTTGLHDSQVQYWEPAKWVAKLREKKTDDNMLLLYTDMGAGHGGASGRFEQHRETALKWAFLMKLAGIES
jgi:oligopeptidase B